MTNSQNQQDEEDRAWYPAGKQVDAITLVPPNATMDSSSSNFMELLKAKAEKHRTYFRTLIDSVSEGFKLPEQMASNAQQSLNYSSEGSPSVKRYRRRGVCQPNLLQQEVTWSVKQLRDDYLAMTKPKEIFLAPPQSDYGSSSNSDDERWHRKHRVTRCESTDSAMGQSDENDELKDGISPKVPSKTLIEAQTVMYPVDRKISMELEEGVDFDNSRRQSCFTDDGEDASRYRCWRTPSVVVSDYSDDIMGLTLEDIEYIRSHRKEPPCSSSPDSSVHSSCSNLNYCGSTISSLESDYVLVKPHRKTSNCSTCSTLSGDEDTCDNSRSRDGTLSPRSKSREWVMSVIKETVPSSEKRFDGMRNKLCLDLLQQKNAEVVKLNDFENLESPAITCSPSPCVFSEDHDEGGIKDYNICPSRSPSPSPRASPCQSPRFGKRRSSFRRSRTPSTPQTPSSPLSGRRGSCTGYEQYQKSLLEVPYYTEYGEPSSDDLSSEWESERDEPRKERGKSSGWRKLRNIVQWTPFFQTYKKHRYPWVQLAGHQGNFKAGPDQGTILKKLCVKEEKCFQVLMKDVLRPYVPEYRGLVASDDGESEYIQLQDLLGDFISPCVMDCKIGVRTYLEEELAKAKEKPKLRKDMYEKMCQIDDNAPTDEEHKLKGVTKPRYMVWRETISSTATLGFRIEGLRNADGTSTKDFKTTKSKNQIMEAFEKFTEGFPHAVPKYIQRLKAIRATLQESKFFETHEVIGSSLLFVHDHYNANVWLIDFAKTVKLPTDIKINHDSKWKVGNHEDGYLIGINNLIKIFMAVLENQPVSVSLPLSLTEVSQSNETMPPPVEKT